MYSAVCISYIVSHTLYKPSLEVVEPLLINMQYELVPVLRYEYLGHGLVVVDQVQRQHAV